MYVIKLFIITKNYTTSKLKTGENFFA